MNIMPRLSNFLNPRSKVEFELDQIDVQNHTLAESTRLKVQPKISSYCH